MRNAQVQSSQFTKPRSPRIQWITAAGFGLTLIILGYIAAGFVGPDFSDWYGSWVLRMVALLGLASFYVYGR